MGLKPVNIDRRFPKSEVTKADVEKEKAIQEGAGGQCELTDEGNKWRLVCKFFEATEADDGDGS